MGGIGRLEHDLASALALAPSQQNYSQITRDPQAKAGRAYLWLAIVFLVGGAISAVIGFAIQAVFGPYTNPLFPTFPAQPLTLSNTAFNLLCGVPVGAVALLIGLTVLVALSHLLALLLDGKGSLGPLLYTYAAFYVLLFLCASFLQNLPYLNLLNLATGLYGLLLSVVATKAVHRFGWAKAALAGLLIPFLTGLLIIGLVVGGLA